MKKLNLGNVTDVFIESVNKTHLELQNVLKEIKQEYTQNIIEEKIKLLMLVCEGENLDFNSIKTKYLKSKELSQLVEKPSVNIVISDDNIMDKLEVDGKQYYSMMKENSIVYDMNSKVVGRYVNNKVLFDV